MTNRLLLGRRRDSEYGFYISKPGCDVLTASDDLMLFTSNRKMFQLIGKGAVLFTDFNQVRQIWVPNVGRTPLVFARSTNYAVEAQVIDNNTINLISRNQSYSITSGNISAKKRTAWCQYFITNQVFF